MGIIQRGSAPNVVMGFVLLLLTVAVVHQTMKLHQLEKGSLEANILLSRRSVSENVVMTKTHPSPGAIYTRWGRTTCPATSSELVYHGVVGGQHQSHTGGGSNILCLPMDPTWGKYSDALTGGSQHIYGGEYKITDYVSIFRTGLFSGANANQIENHNIPCAVCQTLTPATIMMLPARLNCYRGWTLEYSGYLMSALHDNKGRNPFTCVDFAPEGESAGFREEGGALFYHVQGSCGSLPCPPYVNGRELTCAVCSQRLRAQVHRFGFNNETKELIDLQ